MRWRPEARCAGTACALVLLCGACTPWVKLSDPGATVRVVPAAEVADCERVGRTTVKGVEKLLGASRLDYVVERELRDMARNEAPALGGDTLVTDSPIVEGRQSFLVYRCGT